MSRRVRPWSVRIFVVTLLAALLAAASAALLAGCGGANPAAAATPAATHSARQILASVYTANPKMKTATATYDVTLAVQPVPGAAASSSLGPLANGPVSVKGAITVSLQPMAIDVTADVSATGIEMKMGMRFVGDKAWIQYLGQWYALPTDAIASMSRSLRQSSASRTLLTELGIDPMKWTKDLTLVGVETVAGKRVYHLKMSLNLPQFVADLAKIMSSPQFKSLAAGQGSALTGSAPTAKDLADMGKAVKKADAEIWAATDTFYTTKALLSVNLVLPKKDQKDAGFSSLKLDATLLYSSIDQPVSVKAPANAKPSSDLGLSLGGSPLSSSSSGSSAASTPAPTYDASASAEAKVKTGVRTIVGGIQKYARANNTYPAMASAAVLAKYVPRWPVNPFTGAPMANNDTAGDYQYSVTADSFSIIGFGADGNVVISLP